MTSRGLPTICNAPGTRDAYTSKNLETLAPPQSDHGNQMQIWAGLYYEVVLHYKEVPVEPFDDTMRKSQTNSSNNLER